MSDEEKPRLVGRPFPKGVSGNPTGRKRGIERQVRELIGDDLEKLIKAQIRIAQGLPPEEAPEMEIKAADATRAYEALIDRGWGKAKQQIEITGDLAVGAVDDLTPLTEEQLAVLAILDAGDPTPTTH